MPLPIPRSIQDGLLERVQTIDRPAPSTTTNESKVEITNIEYIGSYNWLDRKSPSLIIPGSPNEWVDKKTPFTLGHDTGIVVADQNAYRVPDTPLLPLFVAVNVKSSLDTASSHNSPSGTSPPHFDWPSNDFITDRNNLRKLLRWINNSPDSDFRIDVQLAGKKTILMSRYTTNVREKAAYGFGHSFEKACTKPAAQCEGGVSHHRIIRYDMNGLKMVVRYEVDGYLPDTSPYTHSWRQAASAAAPTAVNNLADTPASVKFTAATPESTPKFKPKAEPALHAGLTVYPGGSWSIPQSSILEMKTRSQRNFDRINWSELHGQLYVSQTLHCFIGIHQQGTFSTLVRQNLRSAAMERVRAAEQPKLKALRWVLGVIQDLLVKRGGNARVSLVSEAGVLGVYECKTDGDCLPKELMEYFDSDQ
ncbi:hypothetical protein PLEOSDRAFT_1078415 [Pleurotus ostreatus PC15]|uniref:Decapping nuclease n=1 Tax=Pleurotus ostreatus (strain PC15) TaxID=1137138 RepID=A0A067NEE5_PLEO1|nr:hypothetical protein PLEOSDRAFT_1078415 [Pleurotus ostreatus PC15]